MTQHIEGESMAEQVGREIQEKDDGALLADLAKNLTSDVRPQLGLENPKIGELLDEEMEAEIKSEWKEIAAAAEQEEKNASANSWLNRLEKPYVPTAEDIKEARITNQAIKIIDRKCNEYLSLASEDKNRQKKITFYYDRLVNAVNGLNALLDDQEDLAQVNIETLKAAMKEKDASMGDKARRLHPADDDHNELLRQHLEEFEHILDYYRKATDLNHVINDVFDTETIEEVPGNDLNLDALKVKGLKSALLYGIQTLSPELKKQQEQKN